MPIRPANLATMSATIAGALAGMSGTAGHVRPVTVTFESGHEQVVEAGGCRVLDADQGGVVSIGTEAPTRYALYEGTSCQGGQALATGSGSVTFGDPVPAGAIVVG
ncbi:phosphatase [Nocardiopsis rhodophaea]|uniref:phosphatase n=1 Tax=Nocardiopsis rhodophaea TaxID=280238 RepID=UPI0031D92862